jgi:hypothetical protein
MAKNPTLLYSRHGAPRKRQCSADDFADDFHADLIIQRVARVRQKAAPGNLREGMPVVIPDVCCALTGLQAVLASIGLVRVIYEIFVEVQWRWESSTEVCVSETDYEQDAR